MEPTNWLPDDGEVYLYPDFLSAAMADFSFEHLTSELCWNQEETMLYGRNVALPRLTAWVGEVPYAYSGVVHPPAAWPVALAQLRDRVAEVVPRPNGVLGNLYRHGQDSVSWHADDEAIFGPQPVISSLSLGATRRFVLRRKDDHSERVVIPLPHGSLLVMSGSTQDCWQHSVPKTARIMEPRINLTFRKIVQL